MKRDIVRRYSGNPILTKDAIPYPVETVHNAAVVKRGGEYIMLFRSHLRTGRSIIGLARSADGFHFTADPEPFLRPATEGPFAAYEEYGVPRRAWELRNVGRCLLPTSRHEPGGPPMEP